MAKKVKIDHFFIFLTIFSVKMMFFELFCNVLHHERSHFDLDPAVLVYSLQQSAIVREVRHVCYCELCAPAVRSSFTSDKISCAPKCILKEIVGFEWKCLL